MLTTMTALLAFLSVLVPSSPFSALAEHTPTDPQQILSDYLDGEEARREAFRANGGNDAVHETWARLRELEPQFKESYSTLAPSGFIGLAWYYTKVVLKALFMNAPATQPPGAETVALHPTLSRGVSDLEAAAAFDDPDALYLLAEMNLHGNFTHPRDPQVALEWYTRLAEMEGNSTAQYMLGLLYATGIGGVQQDQAKAMLYHNFAAEQGNVRSEMTLAFRHHTGIATPRDCNIAVGYYKRVADKAMDFWLSGPPGGMHMPRNSYRWVEKEGGIYGEAASASSSGPNGQSEVGQPHVEDVLEFLSMREASGDLSATISIGLQYYDPRRGYRRNLVAARKQFMKIAKLYWDKDGKVSPRAPEGIDKLAGKAAAYIGRMFLRGEGMEQRFDKAVTWFRRGIANGDAFSQYHLGLMYRDGLGVPQDGVKAGKLLKEAAEQGSPSAQSALGVMFLDQGDLDTAGRYFELAASKGVMEAFYYLAELTNLGVGRDRNCGLAAVYYKVVAERAEALHSALLQSNNAYERGDYERAFIPTVMAAEQGYEHAQANVAHLLDQQTSILSLPPIPLISSAPKSSTSMLLNNHELALVYFTRSAKQANTDSLVKMGDYYLSGLIPTSSFTDVSPTPLTDNTDPSPRALLPDIEKATTCYTSAAENHHSSQALWNLGWLHENGIGPVPQDFHMAKRYYDLAYEMNSKAYLPVKLALIKLRCRSWWNGVSGGKVNPIRDEEDEDKSKRPKTMREWLNRFLENFEAMDTEDAQRQQQQDADLDWLAAQDPGMPGGDAEYASRADRGHHHHGGAAYDPTDEWEDFDDGLVETLIIIALAGALALLVYARQQQQQVQRRLNGQRQAQGPEQVGVQPANNAAQQGQQRNQDQDRNQGQAQQPEQDRGMFPRPGEPDFNNWIAGGIGH
jgi:SEL1 protein